ncbi:MAG: hypothetical protein AUK35_01930 [Zetaproteobacteria bacterium CG2_30_46_52]|nr:MAG: hypothetical protein AUK35_01930 [Zetaproteobacteria bacterium CG2_30_46_52]
MNQKVSKKDLEEALKSYAQLIEVYPDNESYLKRYADMLLTMGRESTATTALKHLHDLIVKRSPKEAEALAKQYPQIGRLTFSENAFDTHDQHAIAGQLIHENLGSVWLRLQRKKLQEGQAVYRADDLSDSLNLLLEGQVEIYGVGTAGDRVLLEQVGILDVIGEHTFLKPGRVKIEAFVTSPTATIVEVPASKLNKIIAKNPFLKKLLEQRVMFRTYTQVIATLPVFQPIPMKLKRHLARNLSIHHIPAKSFVHALDRPFTGIDIIVAGHACYLASNKEGKKIPLPPLHIHAMVGNIQLQPANKLEPIELVARDSVTVARLALMYY